MKAETNMLICQFGVKKKQTKKKTLLTYPNILIF